EAANWSNSTAAVRWVSTDSPAAALCHPCVRPPAPAKRSMTRNCSVVTPPPFLVRIKPRFYREAWLPPNIEASAVELVENEVGELVRIPLVDRVHGPPVVVRIRVIVLTD